MSKFKLPPIQTDEDKNKLWNTIKEAGGVDNYVRNFLYDQGFSLQVLDTSTMSKTRKAKYKEEKRNEAEARRAIRKCAWSAYKHTHLVHLGDGIFYNDLVDADRFDIEKREARIQQNQLPDIKSVDALAEYFKLSIPQLRWYSYNRNADRTSHYARFTIPKSDGTERIISAPKPRLKALQHKILHEILGHLPIHGAAHGFVPGRSIATHANLHAKQDIVVKMDLKDFFPTLTFPRVKGLFRKIGYPEQVAVILALLCTEPTRVDVEHKNQTYHVALTHRALPQGAPTSPAITNLICLRLDRRMSGLARKHGWKYSRYADDLVFSTSQNKPDIKQLLTLSRNIIRSEGFLVHPNKTHVMRQGNRQKVTGLIVNESAQDTLSRPPRKLIRQVRAAIHNRLHQKPHKAGESIAQLRGLAAFIHQTNPTLGRKFLEQIQTIEQNEEKAL